MNVSRQRHRRAPAALLLALVAAACGGRSTPAPATPALDAAAPAAPAAEPSATALEAAWEPGQELEPEQAPVEQEPPRALRLWIPPALAPVLASEAASEAASDAERTGLAELLTVWSAETPGEPPPEIGLRAGRGDATGLAFLETLDAVAPSRVPDLIVLPLDELPHAREAGLLAPIEDARLRTRAEEAPGFVRALAGPQEDEDGAVYALPLALDFAHWIARGDGAPARLDALDAEARAAVPAAAPSLAALTPLVSAYAEAGGPLDELPAVRAEALRRAAGAISSTVAAGGLAAAEGTTAEDAWRAFLEQERASGLVSAGRYARLQSAFPGLSFGPPPGVDGPGPAVATAWVAAIPARAASPARAAALLAWLTEPERADWPLALDLLPARPPEAWVDALAEEDRPSPAYVAFLARALREAAAPAGHRDWAPAWSGALAALYEGRSADEAIGPLLPTD